MTVIYTFRFLLFLIGLVLVVNCSNQRESQSESSSADSTAFIQPAEETGVTGDFDGDGRTEKILTRLVHDANFNPEEPWNYIIEFSDPKLPSMELSPMQEGGFSFLNEGNMDGKPGDEFSLMLCGMNNSAALSLYGFNGKEWGAIAESVDVVCTILDAYRLEDLLVKTDSGVYALEFEMLQYDSSVSRRRELVLATTSGDFDGNGETENVYVKTLHDAGLDDSGFWEYSISFSDSKFPPIPIENHEAGGCLVENNGKSNGKPSDELSITTFGMMNKMNTAVYGFNGKKWEQLPAEMVERSIQ
jgi:hypothetical protein